MTPASQNNPLYKNADKKSMYATIILLVTIISTFLITSNLYATYTSSKEEKSSLDSRTESLKSELDALNKKKDQVSNDTATKAAISQFAWDYREDIILNQIYSKFDWIIVHDINMDKWQKLPSWLNMANININIDAKNIAELNKYLNYLTQESSSIRFVIKSASFPMNSENTNSSVSTWLNLGMYYFEQ
ncbi:MAG: hypothetical protein ACD_3C00043G0011 [uncultured bacterium (gcode 4)]|uniref:Uncharacterized protein n=1 Tax=uncultured bacterium (gcode 4) TaxID=1234023 RepID=K2G2S8_9BACT|nr:MAG: hypothetical protein ACD_3C00043G0011 [uncultured bacterium (gcode 4)]